MIFSKLYSFLTSAKLAMALLIAILLCCILGVTILRGDRAWTLIFNTLWFNGLLVLLVLNVGFCFFGRIWGRKVTLTSIGMILFHLSFVAMLGGIVYNSLFYFRGMMRLTEGEILPNGDLQSYDSIDKGRFFNFSKLKGGTALVRVHVGYKVDGINKRVAYEIAVGDGHIKKQGIIYTTQNLNYNGFSYFNSMEGYSIVNMLYDKHGKEIYGGIVALQSLKQRNDKYLYTTGTKIAPDSFPFPQKPLKPLFALQVAYQPDPKKERGGSAIFKVWPIIDPDVKPEGKPLAEVKAAIGEKIRMGEYHLSAEEVRYWVGMNVRHEPGKPVVLTSLWIGLGGMVITFIGRMRSGKKKAISVSEQ